MTDVLVLFGRGRFFRAPLWKLQFQRRFADEAFEGCDPCLILLEQIG